MIDKVKNSLHNGMEMCQAQIIPIHGARLWTALQGQGQPLVLCHGGAGAYDYLKPVADMVADVCRILRYDQRGSGRSEVVEPYTVASFVQDLEGLRQYCQCERWIVGGHSWGAVLALAYAVTFPERTAALIYISGTGIDPTWQEVYQYNRLAALTASERAEFGRLRAQLNGAIGAERQNIRQRFRALSRKADVAEPANVAKLPTFADYPTSDEVNRQIGADWDTYINDPRFHQAVAQLSMPTLFLHGADDPRPASIVQALAANIPGSQVQIIPRAGHYPWIEQTESFKEVLRQFLVTLNLSDASESV